MANNLDTNEFGNAKNFARVEPIRFENVRQAAELPKSRSGFAGMVLFAIMFLLAGLLGVVAKGSTGSLESYTGSAQSLMGFLFLAMGAAAVVCFGMAVRWLRS
jgi:hypothetical protein